MKNSFLTSALVLGSLSFAYATEPIISLSESVNTVLQDEFKEIKIKEVPHEIIDAVHSNFYKAKIDKAYINEGREYKLEIIIEGEAKIFYADASGKWTDEY